MRNKLKSKKSNISGTSAVDGGSVPPPLPIETDLTRAQAETNLSPFLSPIETDLTRAQAKKELCFLKFYNCLDTLGTNGKKQWLVSFKNNMTDILLSTGFDRIKKMCELLKGSSRMNEPPEKWRIIYSHRHMGATRLLEAIKIVWTGEYKGQEQYYNQIQKKERPCKLVSFSNSEDKLATFLDDNLKKWFAKLPNESKVNCPCEAIEEAIIGEIKTGILKYVNEIGSTFADRLKGKKLLLLDDFDVHLCQLYKSNSDTYKTYKIWFYRKCWITAVLSLNKECVDDLAISLVLLTNLREYKVCNYDAKNRKWEPQKSGFGYLGGDIKYEESVFNLYEAYDSIKSAFNDACFFKCKPDVIGMYKCSYLRTGKNCKFALSEDYWHEDSVPASELKKPEYTQKSKYIQENVLKNRYEKVNNNPWWIIVPLTHVFNDTSGCLYDNADAHLKAYYKGTDDKYLQRRKSGNILDGFFATISLYCQVDCSFDELLGAQKDFKDIILNRLREGYNDVELKRPSTDGHSEKKENIMVKMMLEDSGLVKKKEEGDSHDNWFWIHPFVCYVYSDNEKYFEKE